MRQAKRSNPSSSDTDLVRVTGALRRQYTPSIVQQDAARARLLHTAAGHTMLPPSELAHPLAAWYAAVVRWLFGMAVDRGAWRRSAYLLYGVPHHNSLDHFLSHRLLSARV